ncbi:glycosyltransferase family 8 protein [Paenibacillus endoradicis]|uniref:glycosyltransferase family 8 protein n=1 Tax=Paenibacillus endoradicis TaxID=2972487 RepID=UPI002159002F|nr:glycosyltransferase family 8 protein [Paenibacillus endoradicis]MCR8660517.1 glycosyltransferase family 8 protein [Paenibacillus endoradicis]
MLNIVCSANRSYIQHLCAMISSVSENTTSETIFHVFNDGFTSEEQIHIRNYMSIYSHAFITFYTIDDSIFAGLDIKFKRLTIQTFYRLLASELLPQDVEKALYLDSDIIVEDDVSILLATDLSGYYVGAVNELAPEASYALGHERLEDYFNAGVLLINIKKWREDNFFNQCMEYAVNNQDIITFGDQDILNGLLQGNFYQLELKWNVTYKLGQYKGFYSFLLKEDNIDEIEKNPSIIHYLGNTKPWSIFTIHLHKARYSYYLDKIQYPYIINPEYAEFSKRDIVFFGASKKGADKLHLFNELELQVNYFCDNDANKWSKTYKGIEVISPDQLKQLKNPAIILTSMYADEIGIQLEQLGFVETKDFFKLHMLDLIAWR